MAKILGFDCSSSTVGWGVIEYDDAFNILNVQCGHFKPSKEGTVFEKLDLLKTTIIEICNAHKPDNIVIEDIVKFMAGRSSAQTIITLSVFNRTIGMTCYEFMNKVSPDMLSVMTIRHKIKEDKVIPKKEDVPARLEVLLNYKFPYLFNKKGKIKEETYDRADGLAVATAWYLTKKTPAKVKKVKKK